MARERCVKGTRRNKKTGICEPYPLLPKVPVVLEVPVPVHVPVVSMDKLNISLEVLKKGIALTDVAEKYISYPVVVMSANNDVPVIKVMSNPEKQLEKIYKQFHSEQARVDTNKYITEDGIFWFYHLPSGLFDSWVKKHHIQGK
jgi:hypothetical protein